MNKFSDLDIFSLHAKRITLENIINYNDSLIHYTSRQWSADFIHIYKNWEKKKTLTKLLWDPSRTLFPTGGLIHFTYKKLSNLTKNNLNIKIFNIVNGHISGRFYSTYFTNAFFAIYLNFYMSSVIDEIFYKKIQNLENVVSYPSDIEDLYSILRNLNIYSTYKATSIAWEYLDFYDKQLRYRNLRLPGPAPTETIINIINGYHLKNVIMQLYCINKQPIKYCYLSGFCLDFDYAQRYPKKSVVSEKFRFISK